VEGGVRTVSCCLVDDLLSGSKSEEAADGVAKRLGEKLNLTNLGDARFYLSMEIQRKPGLILLSQTKYTADMLERFGMTDVRERSVPLDPGTKLSREAGELLCEADATLFMEMTGSLMYLSCCTRPDISHSVGLLARAFKQPRTLHLDAAKSIMRYVAGTREYGIEYGSGSGFTMYSDSDFAADVDTRRSTTGYVGVLYGGAVSWKSRLQPTVAVSTCEAEYMAAGEAVREALWWRKLLPQLGIDVEGGIPIRGDNQSTLAVLSNPISSERTKHIDVVHHFARERAELGEVVFSYISTKEMVADGLTKALGVAQFKWFRDAMGVKSWS
jgi:hypothetical protein